MLCALLEKVSDLNDMILQGKILEAFDKYYHEDVLMQENDETPTVGKAENRKREEDFLGSILEWRSAQPVKVAIGEGFTMVEWFLDYTHKDWGEKKLSQVSIQEWEDGKIIKEKFIYNH